VLILRCLSLLFLNFTLKKTLSCLYFGVFFVTATYVALLVAMYEYLIDSPAIHMSLFHWIFRNRDRSRRRRQPSGYRNSRSNANGSSGESSSSMAPDDNGSTINPPIPNQIQNNHADNNNLQVEDHVIPLTADEIDVMLDLNSEFWARLRDPVARRRDIALTYEMIYHPLLSVLNAEEVKTWMWLSVALLINVACIQIEIILFQGIMEQEQQERGDNSTTTTTTPLTTPGINRYLRSG
jgi:hypothetical protein